MAEQLLRFDAVKARTGLGRSKLYELMGRGEFPRPIPITTKIRAWAASEVDQWVDSKVAAARNPNRMEA